MNAGGRITISEEAWAEKTAALRKLREENMVLNRRINALQLQLDMVRGKDRPEYLTTAQAAELLQLTPAQVGHWIRDGVLPAFQIRKGGDWRISYMTLVAFIGEHTINRQEALPV